MLVEEVYDLLARRSARRTRSRFGELDQYDAPKGNSERPLEEAPPELAAGSRSLFTCRRRRATAELGAHRETRAILARGDRDSG